jgi:hypothetical protein
VLVICSPHFWSNAATHYWSAASPQHRRQVGVLYLNPIEPFNSVQQTRGVLEVVGAARVDREEFPELLSAIQDTNWPSVVQNEHCQAAYSGGGEGYSGPACTPAAGNQTTIVLDLKFLHTVPEPSVGVLSGSGEDR